MADERATRSQRPAPRTREAATHLALPPDGSSRTWRRPSPGFLRTLGVATGRPLSAALLAVLDWYERGLRWLEGDEADHPVRVAALQGQVGMRALTRAHPPTRSSGGKGRTMPDVLLHHALANATAEDRSLLRQWQQETWRLNAMEHVVGYLALGGAAALAAIKDATEAGATAAEAAGVGAEAAASACIDIPSPPVEAPRWFVTLDALLRRTPSWDIARIKVRHDRPAQPTRQYARGEFVRTPGVLVDVPYSAGSDAVARSLHADKGTLWARDERGYGVFIDPSNGARITMTLAGEMPDATLSIDQQEVVWTKVRALGPETSLVYMIALAKWMADEGQHLQQGLLTSTSIYPNDILELQGVQKRKHGGYDTEQKLRVREHLVALSSLWLHADGVTTPEVWTDRNGRVRYDTKKVRLEGRVMNVTHVISDDPHDEDYGAPYKFHVVPGDWVRYYIGPSAWQRTALVKKVLEYKPYQGVEQMALRLGLYLCSQWRTRAGHGGNYDQVFTLETLLHNACMPIQSNPSLYKRFYLQFHAALARMKADEVIGDYSYANWDIEAGLRQEGYFRTWVDTAKIVIAPPHSVIDQYRAMVEQVNERKQLTRARRASAKAAPPGPPTSAGCG